MKSIIQSIKKTAQWLKHDFAMFDYAFFTSQVIAGLIKDGFTKVDPPVIEGEWLHAYDKQGRAQEINVYQLFQTI